MKNLFITAVAVTTVAFGCLVMSDPFTRPTVAVVYKPRPSAVTKKVVLPPVPAVVPATDNSGKASTEGSNITIPSLDLHLSVRRGVYSPAQNTWLVPGNAAYLADGSAFPNASAGTTYIYGHQNRSAFGALKQLSEGDVAVLKISGNSYYYRLAATRITTPEDTTLLQSDGPPQLVLQTCTGTRYEYRVQYIFEFMRSA